MKLTPYIITTILFILSIYHLRPEIPTPKPKDIATPTLQSAASQIMASGTEHVQSDQTAANRTLPSVPAYNSQNQVHQFLDKSQTIKHLVSTDIAALVEDAKKVLVPEGHIVRHKKSPSHEYKEMVADDGSIIKKIISDGQMLSETYANPKKGMSFERKYTKLGELDTLSLRWNNREAVILDFYSNGQLAAVVEAVEGKSTEQRWDMDNNLIAHKTTGIFNGAPEVVDHLKDAQEPTEEQDFDDTETL